MSLRSSRVRFFFFFNDTATTEIYTLSLHDALPILRLRPQPIWSALARRGAVTCGRKSAARMIGPATRCGKNVMKNARSEEHTSELQSRLHLVCRLLLEKKKQKE